MVVREQKSQKTAVIDFTDTAPSVVVSVTDLTGSVSYMPNVPTTLVDKCLM